MTLQQGAGGTLVGSGLSADEGQLFIATASFSGAGNLSSNAGARLSANAAFVGTGALFANDRFSPGKYDETGEVASLAFTGDRLTELEYGLKLDIDTLATGDLLRFRVYVNGVALDAYSVTPTITIPAHVFNAVATFGGSGSMVATPTVPPVTVTLAGSGALVADTLHFSKGAYDETGEAASVAVASDAYTEFEFGLKLDLSTLALRDVLRFRVYVNGVALDVYSLTPTVTVTTASIVAAFAGIGNLSATGRSQLAATAVFVGAGNFSAAARQRLAGAASFAGAGDFNTTATLRLRGAATFVGSGNLAVDAIRITPASALFAGTGNVNASAIRLMPASRFSLAQEIFPPTQRLSQAAMFLAVRQRSSESAIYPRPLRCVWLRQVHLPAQVICPRWLRCGWLHRLHSLAAVISLPMECGSLRRWRVSLGLEIYLPPRNCD